jgi:hypothetical protein
MRTMREAMAGRMKGEHWSRVNLRGISPYAIDRVDGTVTISRPWAWGSRKVEVVDVRAYDLRLPDGTTRRFSRLIDAKDYARMLVATNGKGVTA